MTPNERITDALTLALAIMQRSDGNPDTNDLQAIRSACMSVALGIEERLQKERRKEQEAKRKG